MNRISRLTLACLAVAALGCYHATVETGLTPSNQVINKSFASGWLFGLIPPSTVKAASACPSGVARIETQLSFVNQLVGWLTAYIYTPMQITVTCAQGGRSSLEPGSAEIRVGPETTSRQGSPRSEI